MRTQIILYFACVIYVALTTRTGQTISAGDFVTCALGVDQKPYCRGNTNLYGLLNPPDVAMTAIACGDNACCGLASGVANCWGDFSEGGEHSVTAAPTDLLSYIVARGHRICGLKQGTNKAVCWGLAFSGSPPDLEFLDISVSDYNGWGIKTDGSIVCWGNCHSNYVTRTPSGAPPFYKISHGIYEACGLSSVDNTVFCWSATETDMLLPTNSFLEIVQCYTGRACGILESNRSALCWSFHRNRPALDGFQLTEGPFEHLSCLGYLSGHTPVVGLRDGTVVSFAGRDPPASWPVIPATASTPCSSQDSCSGCRDGSITVLNSQTGQLVDGGGHCFLSNDTCVDVYTYKPCYSDINACPDSTTTAVKPEYLEPVWYQECADNGRRIVQSPGGCNGSGYCAAKAFAMTQ